MDSFTVSAILADANENDYGNGGNMSISREMKARYGMRGGKKVAAEVQAAFAADTKWYASQPGGNGYGSLYVTDTTGTKPVVWKCRHYHKEFVLPNGLVMQGSSMTGVVKRRHRAPDFGLYLDAGWLSLADWRAEFIRWPDYGVPRIAQVAADAITEAYQRITEGWLVETGCIGGHGRTGTVLACMVILAGETDPEAAMRYVWKNYCTEAIESKAQMDFIRWFASE